MIIKLSGSFYSPNCNNDSPIELGDLTITHYIVCFLSNYVVGQKGFSVYKSVPYGPVGEALAYLARRANENKDVIKRTELERSLLKQELKRRITAS